MRSTMVWLRYQEKGFIVHALPRRQLPASFNPNRRLNSTETTLGPGTIMIKFTALPQLISCQHVLDQKMGEIFLFQKMSSEFLVKKMACYN